MLTVNCCDIDVITRLSGEVNLMKDKDDLHLLERANAEQLAGVSS